MQSRPPWTVIHKIGVRTVPRVQATSSERALVGSLCSVSVYLYLAEFMVFRVLKSLKPSSRLFCGMETANICCAKLQQMLETQPRSKTISIWFNLMRVTLICGAHLKLWRSRTEKFRGSSKRQPAKVKTGKHKCTSNRSNRSNRLSSDSVRSTTVSAFNLWVETYWSMLKPCRVTHNYDQSWWTYWWTMEPLRKRESEMPTV